MENFGAFDLRYHHIGYVYELARTLCSKNLPLDEAGRWIPFDKIYMYSEIGENAAYILARESGHYFAMKASFSSRPSAVYWADMVGEKGEFTDRFIQASAQSFAKILLTSPEERITITQNPDIICRECQIFGDGRPGAHCLEPIDDFNNWDFYYKVALSSLYEDRRFIGLDKDSASGTFRINAGLLRSIPFLEEVERLVTLGHKQIQRSMTQYINY